MGLGGISVWQLLIVLLIVVMLFGTRRLRTVGEDLGGAIRSFRKATGDMTGLEIEQKK
ncbi:MAG: twin-arginine translocase TatA/TatE family subunit [Gammaproteobacteria bacterium]|nr:twin-arginine translocase TatA/TatE family subunit [Gammaproteobacteria bacterium]